ncbi:hypothetical protein FPO35_14075 (plasmid) [Staphylococcus aureus]|nr:hypothetical protein FPO35_14075 [Staphylococcus aureus]
MAKMRISPELKKLIEKYRCVKDTEGMSPAKVYKLVGENENLYLKMTDSRYKGTTYDVEREKEWYDIAFCVRSIREDIGEEQYVELFFDLLGIKPDWEKIKYYILLDELF